MKSSQRRFSEATIKFDELDDRLSMRLLNILRNLGSSIKECYFESSGSVVLLQSFLVLWLNCMKNIEKPNFTGMQNTIELLDNLKMNLKLPRLKSVDTTLKGFTQKIPTLSYLFKELISTEKEGNGDNESNLAMLKVRFTRNDYYNNLREILHDLSIRNISFKTPIQNPPEEFNKFTKWIFKFKYQMDESYLNKLLEHQSEILSIYFNLITISDDDNVHLVTEETLRAISQLSSLEILEMSIFMEIPPQVINEMNGLINLTHLKIYFDNADERGREFLDILVTVKFPSLVYLSLGMHMDNIIEQEFRDKMIMLNRNCPRLQFFKPDFFRPEYSMNALIDHFSNLERVTIRWQTHFNYGFVYNNLKKIKFHALERIDITRSFLKSFPNLEILIIIHPTLVSYKALKMMWKSKIKEIDFTIYMPRRQIKKFRKILLKMSAVKILNYTEIPIE